MTSKDPLVKSRSEGCEGNASEPSELLIGLGSALCLVVCRGRVSCPSRSFGFAVLHVSCASRGRCKRRCETLMVMWCHSTWRIELGQRLGN